MASKEDLQSWIIDALRAMGNSAPHLAVAKHVWTHRERELKDSGDLLYTWQYDLRWAAYELRLRGVLGAADRKRNGIWELRTAWQV